MLKAIQLLVLSQKTNVTLLSNQHIKGVDMKGHDVASPGLMAEMESEVDDRGL